MLAEMERCPFLRFLAPSHDAKRLEHPASVASTYRLILFVFPPPVKLHLNQRPLHRLGSRAAPDARIPRDGVSEEMRVNNAQSYACKASGKDKLS